MRGKDSGTGDLAGMGLLLCGRHELYVSSLAALLSSRGVKVRLADSPDDIPERLPSGVDAVLLESPLPSELRRVAARGAPVLVLAERVEPHDALVAAQLGASALLDKNTSLAELVGALRRLSEPLPSGVDPLTPRQREVLALIVEGLDNQAIATRLGITERTARSHVSSVLMRLGAGNRTQAAVLGLQKGLVACLALVLSICALGQGSGAIAAEPGEASPSDPATVRADARLARSLSAQMLRVGARSGAWVYDVDAGRTLFQLRPTRARTPASTQKLLTSATALERLGPLWRFETTLLTAGEVVDGELAGNVYLKGAGDPSFDSSQLERLADTVWETGVDRVDGRVYGDESLFDSLRGGPASGFGISPWVGPLSALSLNRGTLAPTGRGFQSEPARFVAARLTTALRKHGVHVARQARAGRGSLAAVPIASVVSPALAALVRRMNLPSDNYYAEMLIKGLGARFGSSGSTAGGAAVVRRFAQRMGARARVVDGSGLSRANAIAPRALGRLLVRSYSQGWFDSLYRSLPVAGRSGTLRKRMRGSAAAGRCHAKTGTLIAVSALAGFCRSYSGHTLVFALLMNGVNLTVARSAQDRVAAALAAYRG